MKTFASILIVIVLFLTGTVSSIYADQNPPEFPMCSNPIGSITADYSTGTHGIVGSAVSFTGADKVYTFANDNALQCFCPSDGAGIQTNWWKIDTMTEFEIKEFENVGWMYVANGDNWGLAQGPYLAKNINFSCQGGNSNNGSNGGSSKDNYGGGSSSNSGSGSVIGARSVLGLATTGSMIKIIELITFGFVLIGIGLMLRKTVKA